MHIDGEWVGYGPGDDDPKIAELKVFMRRKFAAYASVLDPDSTEYTDTMVRVVKEMQSRYGLPATGIIDYATQVKMGFIDPGPEPMAVLPVMFTVEGHMSNMFAGPVADTAGTLEREGVCRHQPTGYNNGAIPFDNNSGVVELARLVGLETLDNGAPFPAGTPFSLGIFSQGAIVGFDFYVDYLLPGKPLNWRLKDLRGVLAYGNPCRGEGSIAPWARPWVDDLDTFGLDPYRRFGIDNFPAKPDNWMDVYREGDIFAENTDDTIGEIKAAVYQAVARGDLFSDPYSLAIQIADIFLMPFEQVWSIIMAIVSGVTFLGTGDDNPHYSPYDIGGGIDWMRQQLTAVPSAA